MNSDPKVSIVVPVYNVDRYLNECFDSLKNQTYKNLEIIVVDDGSTDGSGIIADAYKNCDDRFLVFHCKNTGISAARNLGLKYATGDYITFVDGDDAITSIHIQSLVDIALHSKADIVLGGKLLWFRDRLERKGSSKVEFKQISLDEAFRSIFSIKPWHNSSVGGGYVTTKFFTKAIAKSTLFSSSKNITEDELYCSQVFLKAKKIVASNCSEYLYRRRSSSLSSANFFGCKLLHTRLRIKDAVTPLQIIPEKTLDVAICLALFNPLSYWNRVKDCPLEEKKFVQKVNQQYLPTAKKLTRTNELSFKVFISMWLLKKSSFILHLAVKTYKLLHLFQRDRYPLMWP